MQSQQRDQSNSTAAGPGDSPIAATAFDPALAKLRKGDDELALAKLGPG